MSVGVFFAPAEPAHIPGIHAIEKMCFPDPWSEESFAREFSDPLARYVVALEAEGGEVIGYAGYWNIVGEAHITNVAVHPGYRRMGVARGLMQAMLGDAASLGIRDATLEVREDNAEALGLYAQFGFKSCGRRRNYYPKERKDALILWRRG